VEAKQGASFLKKEAKNFYLIESKHTVQRILIDKVFLLLFVHKKKTPLLRS